jgi:lysophospholipase L1-like esterase
VATFASEAADVPAGAVVFLGSSTISGFPLAARFPGAPALNRGISGETALGLLGRIDASLPVTRPAGAVLYTGVNDLRHHSIAPPEVVARVGRVLDAIEARFPGVPAAIVEGMPERDDSAETLGRLHALNDGLRSLAEQRRASLVRTNRPPLATAEGRLSPAMTADGVHLNDEGYKVLARWILEDGGAAARPLAVSVP